MNKEQHQPERDQWRALVSGDENAIEWLFDTYSQSLFNYGMKIVSDRELVKDCIQDLFSDLWKNHPRLVLPDSPRLYLFKALKYKIFRDAASNKKKTGLLAEQDEANFELSAESVMIAEQTASENSNTIQNALSRLTQRQREALMLRYFEDMSHSEIADLLNINKQSVYNLIYSALESLKKVFSKELNLLALLLAGPTITNFSW